MDITADATSELVGINRGMLDALNAMQGRVGDLSKTLLGAGGYFGHLLSKDDFFTGADKGINLGGGNVGELIDSATSTSYTESKKLIGDYRVKRESDANEKVDAALRGIF